LKLYLYYIGKPRDPHANALAADYLARISHYSTAQSSEIRPDRFDLFARHASARKIFLDPLGRTMDSQAFAQLIGRNEMSGQDLVFLVGGHDGLPPEWRDRGDLLLSLSAMTFPHELARAMLAEQIYRGFAILRGHPYPR
jgi:23S rRNA (pseudouridine1915-N3)-methyltransferase